MSGSYVPSGKNGYPSYAQAKMAAIDYTITDKTWLRRCASVLASRLAPTDEDLSDAQSLMDRHRRI